MEELHVTPQMDPKQPLVILDLVQSTASGEIGEILEAVPLPVEEELKSNFEAFLNKHFMEELIVQEVIITPSLVTHKDVL